MGEHLQNSTLRERECLHRSPGLPGTLYPVEKFSVASGIGARRRLVATGHARKLVALSLGLIFSVFFVSVSAFVPQVNQPVRRPDYVGDEKCLSCHREQKSFLVTAHHLTSRLPTADSIAGKFGDGANVLRTSNPELFYRMEATKDGFYQTAVLGAPPDTATLSRRFDFVIGSARKGQTYLYWGENDRLFQLPASYWTAPGRWVNSPGYQDGDLNFGRPISPRCLECHASYFEPLAGLTGNRYNRADYILGISCEKCHGQGREHVARQTSQAAAPPAGEIINPAKLSRARQVEVCALCHGGIGVEKAPAFSYVPGRPLGDYLELKPPEPGEVVDVHGNQVTLLERSRCFQASAMTCSTCHDVHLPQRNAAAFSASCLSCHKVESCGVYKRLGHKIAENCVDCHMPKLTSNAIVSTNEGGSLQPQVRTHWIKVYEGTGAP